MIKRLLPLGIICSLFLLLKLTGLSIRVSDSNIYFYTAYQLLRGKLLYKDIFFTNFPLLPYISMLYFFLIGKHLEWYYLTASLEAIGVACVLYYLVINKTKSTWWASLTSLCYLFSFIVLSTSDHQTGVFLASLLAVLAYLFKEKKQFLWAGIFLGLMLLTKAYFLPVAASLLLMESRQTKAVLQLIGGSIAAAIVILLPTLFFARTEFIRDVFIYSLTRSQGIEKMPLLWFFIEHDMLLIAAMLFSLWQWKKYPFFALLSVTGMVFVLLYQDLYYLYLNFLVPFLCLLIAPLGQMLERKFHLQPLTMTTIIAILLFLNLSIYISSYQDLQKIPNLGTITTIIQKEHPSVLYGTNTLAPALSYLTGIPLLGNVVDTNENIYRKGFLNATTMTQQAISSHALLIAQGAYYPEYGVTQDITDGIFDPKQVQASCRLLSRFPVHEEGVIDEITLWRCE